MTRTDQLHGTDIRPGAPTSCGPAAGSATGPDSEATNRTVVGTIDRACIDRVAP